jgi:hypothetical protein
MPYDRRPYSVLEHLARSVLFSRFDNDALMGMFTSYTAYFDATGHPAQQKAIAVSGYVSTVLKWSRFVDEWRTILRSEGIEGAFHATDFLSSHGQFATGWKGNSERRRQFIERLSLCIKRNTNKAFRSTVTLGAYDKLNEEFLFEENFGRPYAYCAMQCTYMVKRWAEKKKAEQKTLIYFEDGDKDKGSFEERHTARYGEKPLFLPKSKGVPFEAADWAGWKVRTLIEEALKEGHTREKGLRLVDSLSALPNVPQDGGVMNSVALREICKHLRIPKRDPVTARPA